VSRVIFGQCTRRRRDSLTHPSPEVLHGSPPRRPKLSKLRRPRGIQRHDSHRTARHGHAPLCDETIVQLPARGELLALRFQLEAGHIVELLRPEVVTRVDGLALVHSALSRAPRLVRLERTQELVLVTRRDRAEVPIRVLICP
jgi:hypothetical protein